MNTSRFRKCFAALVVASVSAGFAAVGAPVSAASDTVVIGFALEPLNLDISGTAGAAIPEVLLNNVYEGLLRIQSDGQIVPGLAQSYTQSKDGLTWTHISDLKFWDSEAVPLYGFNGIPYNV